MQRTKKHLKMKKRFVAHSFYVHPILQRVTQRRQARAQRAMAHCVSRQAAHQILEFIRYLRKIYVISTTARKSYAKGQGIPTRAILHA